MRRNNLFKSLFVSILALGCLSGCDSQAVADAILPPPDTIQREGVNIESITFENVPAEIKIGYFDTYNIFLKVVYSDSYIETYPLTMASFPDDIRHVFNTVGVHTVTIAFKGNVVPYTFNVVLGKPYYLIRYFNYEGKLIQREEVAPGDKPSLTPPSNTTRPNDALFRYDFVKWDKDVDMSHEAIEDIDVYPIYHKVQKRYDMSKNVTPTGAGHHFRVLKGNRNEYYYTYSAFIYLGRIDRVPLLYSNAVEVSSNPTISGDLCFDLGAHNKDYYTEEVVNDIYSKAMNVDTSEYDTYFQGTSYSPKNPAFYQAGVDFNLGTHTDGNVYTLFDGDTSYTEIYPNSMSAVVDSYNEDNTYSYDLKAASEFTDGYYRASIETSIDIVLKVSWNAVDPVSNRYFFTGYEYYFFFNKNNTFPVAEYSDIAAFETTGTILSFDMAELYTVMTEVAGD